MTGTEMPDDVAQHRAAAAAEMRGFRSKRRMSQEDMAKWLNDVLGRRYRKNQISRWESAADPIPPSVLSALHQEKHHSRRDRETGIIPNPSKPIVIAVANQKGGVAKTTTAINIAYGLAARGHKTLLVDMDAQFNATVLVGLDVVDLVRRKLTIENSLLGEVPFTEIIQKVDVDVPLYAAGSSTLLSGAESDLLREAGGNMLLRELLETVNGQFGVVIIDCPPQLSIITLNALTAANYVLIPTQASVLSTIGLTQLMETIHKVAKRTNRQLMILGILPTMFQPRQKSDQATLADINQAYGNLYQIFPAVLRSADYEKAHAAAKIALDVLPATLGISAYEFVADVISGLIPAGRE